MNTREKKQKHSLDKLLGKMARAHNTFDRNLKIETHNKHMDDIKTKYSPSGGKKAFEVGSPFRKSPFRNRKGGWLTKDEENN